MPVRTRLSHAITEYCDHLEARGLARQTVKSRKSTLNIFQRHTGDIYVETITHRHMDLVFSAEPWQASTRNVKLSIYKAFFAWCRNRRYMSREMDPTFGWRMLHIGEQPRTRIPVSEWTALFSACVHPTETMALGTGLFLFLRGSEQQYIQMKHIDLDGGTIQIYRTKTTSWDEMPISAELDSILRDYLTWYSEQVVINPEHYLHPPRIVGTIQRDPVSNLLLAGTGLINPEKAHAKPHKVIQRVLRAAGYPTEWEGEHTLRRSGARAYFDVLSAAGYDGALRRVQSMLGHSSSAITERYLGLDLDRHARNNDIRGLPMFPGLITTSMIPMREANG